MDWALLGGLAVLAGGSLFGGPGGILSALSVPTAQGLLVLHARLPRR